MAANSSEVEQVVARTLRDSLAKLQQTTGELDQAVGDLVSACASARPSNSLPSMMRARSAAASLAASLEVLSKFVVTALQSAPPAETELLAALPRAAAPVSQHEATEPAVPAEKAADEPVVRESPYPEPQPIESQPLGPRSLEPLVADATPQAISEPEPVAEPQPAAPALATSETASSHSTEFTIPTDLPLQSPAFEPPKFEPAFEATALQQPDVQPMGVEPAAAAPLNSEAAPQTAELYELATWQEPLPQPEPELRASAEAFGIDETELALVDASTVETPEPPVASTFSEELPPEAKGFDVLALSPDQQELHRRANRVAKVSMQDVKMLRPKDVALGKEHRDICVRLRDDLEKAHKEYDRRFHAILDDPVDYFYDWMVEILGDGDPETLGEYPYRSRALRH